MADRMEKKGAHFTWSDWVVLLGAALILPVSIYERNWFFLSLSLLIAAAMGGRVLLTKWLASRTQTRE